MTGYEKIQKTIKKYRKKKNSNPNKFVIQEAECEDDEESGEEAGSSNDDKDSFIVEDHESDPEESDESDM